LFELYVDGSVTIAYMRRLGWWIEGQGGGREGISLLGKEDQVEQYVSLLDNFFSARQHD